MRTPFAYITFLANFYANFKTTYISNVAYY